MTNELNTNVNTFKFQFQINIFFVKICTYQGVALSTFKNDIPHPCFKNSNSLSLFRVKTYESYPIPKVLQTVYTVLRYVYTK